MIRVPKVVLLEGINRVGKTTIINEFKERYGKSIEVIKFPYQRKITSQIVFLYREIDRMTDPDQIKQHLEIIHQLFDLDFRQFFVLKRLDADPSKVYFLDRYYPSNLVYAAMHSVPLNPIWGENHYIEPDLTILLKITNDDTKTKYINDFPAYDNTVEVSNNSISNSLQVLTSRQLIWEGQVIYENVLNNLVLTKRIKSWYGVEALQDDTFRNCEKLLLWHGLL